MSAPSLPPAPPFLPSPFAVSEEVPVVEDKVAAALNKPVSEGISAAVWAAYEEQKARRERSALEKFLSEPLEVEGRFEWSVEMGGFKFVPLRSEDGDKMVTKIVGREAYGGVQATIRF